MPTRVFPGRYDSLADICDFVSGAAHQAELSEADTYSVQLAVDEACSNIIQHAYGGENIGNIQCTCEVTKKALTITLHDEGNPFDPSGIPEPKKNVPLENIKPGGAGLFLMRKLMDEVDFNFTPGEGNTLILVKHKP
jgi:serine/threonine-protein kinase RsbW